MSHTCELWMQMRDANMILKGEEEEERKEEGDRGERGEGLGEGRRGWKRGMEEEGMEEDNERRSGGI